MTSKPKSLSVFHFFAGLLVGFFIGVSINRGWATVVVRLIGAGAILGTELFWRRIESYSRKRYLETWEVRRLRGKWLFILTHYILTRGGLICAAFIGPMLSRSVITKQTMMIVFGSLIPFVALMTYLGHESWREREADYEVQLLRDAAEQSRAVSN